MPHASSRGHMSCVSHGSPLPLPSRSNGVHVGVASPVAAAGHSALSPLQNGAHTDPPGSIVGTSPPGHIPPSSGGYKGSRTGPPELELPPLLPSELPELDAPSELLDASLLPSLDVLLSSLPVDAPAVALVPTDVAIPPPSSPHAIANPNTHTNRRLMQRDYYAAPRES